ncbi:hypothetical protein V5799_032446 [Amblyomma americanum]|uniref:Uncharacterized protein n=1 Tax=Amblyomma americanum TaxID=6943 RepID=A0AAQ4DR54_AMBAM
MSLVCVDAVSAQNAAAFRDATLSATDLDPFAALTSVLCCQLPASIGPCVLPAFGCAIPPELFMSAVLVPFAMVIDIESHDAQPVPAVAKDQG